MKLSILFHTGQYRGDHTADVCIPMDPIKGETVEDLCKRASLGNNEWVIGERIEIRLVSSDMVTS